METLTLEPILVGLNGDVSRSTNLFEQVIQWFNGILPESTTTYDAKIGY